MSDSRMNPWFRTWFEAGNIQAAIIGRDGYFVPSSDDADEHDRILALGQLLRWSTDADRARRAAVGLESAIAVSLEDADVRTAYDIAWCYLIVAEGQSASLPIDLEAVRTSLQAAQERAMEVDAAVASRVLQRLAK
jgi:hypothetical protein